MGKKQQIEALELENKELAEKLERVEAERDKACTDVGLVLDQARSLEKELDVWENVGDVLDEAIPVIHQALDEYEFRIKQLEGNCTNYADEVGYLKDEYNSLYAAYDSLLTNWIELTTETGRDLEVLENLLSGAYDNLKDSEDEVEHLTQTVAVLQATCGYLSNRNADYDRVVESMYDAAKDTVAVYDDALLQGLI